MCYYKRATMWITSNNPSYAVIEACHPSIGIIDKKTEAVKSQFFFCHKKRGCTTATRPRHTGTAPCGCGCPRSADVLSARGTPPFFLYLLQKGAEPIPSRPLPVGRGGATQWITLLCPWVLGAVPFLVHQLQKLRQTVASRLPWSAVPTKFSITFCPTKNHIRGSFCVAGLPIIPPYARRADLCVSLLALRGCFIIGSNTLP